MYRSEQIFAGHEGVNNNVWIGTEMSGASAPRGRPRAFDRDQALRSAQTLIWRHGYEAASLSQLEQAMGIGKTSLYAAFGSKLELLRDATDLYLTEVGARIAAVMAAAPTSRAAIAALLETCAHDFTMPDRPRGCFLVAAAPVCSPENAEAQDFLRLKRAAVAALVTERLARGRLEGDLTSAEDDDVLAEFIMTVVHGLSIQARDGSDRSALLASAGMALRALAL
jgi:AcrR family transcriptional regulator